MRCIARSDTFVVVWLWRGNAYVHYPDAAVLALADDELSDHINNRYRDNDIMTAAETDGVDWWRERRYDITK